TYPNNGYVTWSGTSASAAIVAGSAALMRAVDPSLANGVVVNRIARTADPPGTQKQTGNDRDQLARPLANPSTESSEPTGAPPLGGGGPFVGPYVAAALGITSVSPNFGPTTGGTSVTITGTGFTAGQEPSGGFIVTFGGVNVTATRVDNTHLTATTPAHGA